MADDEAPGRGALYRLDPDHCVAEVISPVTISNGIGWSPDGGQMYYVDSPTRRVDVMDYDPATGAIAGRRPFAAIDAGEAIPDGLAVDAEGCVWVALWDGAAVLRFGPDGRLRDSLALPTPRVTSCAFGGPDLETLYITTAAGPGSSGGELFWLRPGVTGLPTHAYQG
jgi:sugar lactone lactonase YvrE